MVAYLNAEQTEAIAKAVDQGRSIQVFGETYVPAVRRGGAWLAYFHDRSGLAVFDEEVEALRYAVSNTMSVLFWRYGADLGDALREARDATLAAGGDSGA